MATEILKHRKNGAANTKTKTKHGRDEESSPVPPPGRTLRFVLVCYVVVSVFFCLLQYRLIVSHSCGDAWPITKKTSSGDGIRGIARRKQERKQSQRDDDDGDADFGEISVTNSTPVNSSGHHSAECWKRDVSHYEPLGKPRKTGDANQYWNRPECCLRVRCKTDERACDTVAATHFDGPDPPCCVHLLRDLAREFDRVMCHLGLEYFAGYGTLLGLIRGDRLLPWTSDNDFLVGRRTLAAMEELWATAAPLRHGLDFFFDGNFYRLGLTERFAGGRLRRWRLRDDRRARHYTELPDRFPYADLFVGDVVDGARRYVDERHCIIAAPHEHLFPLRRRAVYNNTFYVSVPRRPHRALEVWYGPDWHVPDPYKQVHGQTVCEGYSDADTFSR